MCGIAGFVSARFNKEHLKKMTNAIRHRGPDAEGHFFNADKGIGLGHRRLSIIDLSDAANQPMHSSCGRYIIVYNGEVYNFKEIALKLDHIKWKTRSDTEVILEAFAKWGVDFVHEFNGMFAIAIYDLVEEKLFLFRDRIGIKPLYYYYDGHNFAFASELKAINQLKIEKSIDLESVTAFLHLGYIPNNHTIFKEVKKLLPGHSLTFGDNKINIDRYWSIDNGKNDLEHLEPNSIKSRLNDLLLDSVEKRMISDVPLGTFLSGGIDSSLVTALAQQVSKTPINTFSIGFKEAAYNESVHAQKVAQHLGTNHTEFILSEQDALNELESIIDHFDEPYADSSALPTMLVSRMARKHVTVCLSGDGGDELFMGYGAYKWARRIHHPMIWPFRKPIARILEHFPSQRIRRGADVFNAPSANWKSHIFSQEQSLFSEREVNDLLNKTNNSLIDEINNVVSPIKSPAEQQAYFDLNNYLTEDLLAKVDRASMYCSLEVRVPLLDHRVVVFSDNLSEKFKISNGIQKYLLKEILYNYVPKKIMERPKWGFTIPLAKWLSGKSSDLIETYLNEELVSNLGLLNTDHVVSLKTRFLNGEEHLFNKVWALIVLNNFLVKAAYENHEL